jgi:glutaminyl-tRNA synthetase
MSNEENRSSDFIREIVNEHNLNGRFDSKVATRFPPEPNGYLHIGHAKSICLNFGLADEYGGTTNLRFDDTNPTKEEQEFVDAIQEDVRWLGFEWENLHFASDYFDQLYDWAVQLIKEGKAYVDDQTAEEIRKTRGTLTERGTDSPFRNRSIEENLNLFERMKDGEFPDGSRVLRAKIDMTHPNLYLRDPVLYRILHADHHRSGDKWKIYPLYDWAHGQSDSIEEITHSICTLEFENHRPLYDWFIENLGIFAPQQIEFAPLNLSYTVLSKRRLIQMVEQGVVNGWDDPRMPTLSGLRRRGVTPDSIRAFCDTIGVAKKESTIDIALLEHQIRQDLNFRSQRRMAVLDPIKVVITNYPEGQSEELEAINNPEDESAGVRMIPFSGELYIERDDFMEDPPRKFFRLGPGREVRLRYGYFITCTDFVNNDEGEVTEIHCTYDPETKGGYAPDGRKVRGTIHWVSAPHAVNAEVRLYDRLFNAENPLDVEEDESFHIHLNPLSLDVLTEAKLERSLADAEAGTNYQFERKGYFFLDPASSAENLVFNRTITLRDSWAKFKKK